MIESYLLSTDMNSESLRYYRILQTKTISELRCLAKKNLIVENTKNEIIRKLMVIQDEPGFPLWDPLEYPDLQMTHVKSQHVKYGALYHKNINEKSTSDFNNLYNQISQDLMSNNGIMILI